MSYVQVRRCVENENSDSDVIKLNTTPSYLKSDGDGLRRQDAERASRHMQNKHLVRCEARRYEYRLKYARYPPVTTRRVYHEPETVPEGTAHGESETNPVSDREREPASSSSQPPSEPAQTETTHTLVKRLRLQGKQPQAQSDGGNQSQAQNRESSVTTHVPSQPMDFSDTSARVRMNMKRSPLESQGDRSKQRRVMEDPDEDGVIIGEVQVNEEVEHPVSEVSVAEFDDWQLKEYEGTLRELQSQNDFMSFHGVPSSDVVNKEVIKTRWVLKPQGDGVKARFVMKHFATWKDEKQ